MIATDEAANVDSCSFTVTVNDDDVPVPACAVSGNQAELPTRAAPMYTPIIPGMAVPRITARPLAILRSPTTCILLLQPPA
jgi:hypothetical protein